MVPNNGHRQFLTTPDGVGLAVESRGSGPTLVHVRGWISHLDLMWDGPRFRAFFEPLTSHVQLVRYDSRGNGLSESPTEPVTFDGLVADLEAVIDRLALADVTLLGDSYGGPIALAYAATHPERVKSLILANTYATFADSSSQKQREAMASIVSLLRNDPGAAYYVLAGRTNPEQRPDPSREWNGRRALREMQPQVLSELYEVGFTVDVREQLARVTCPALVMHRTEARAIPIALGRRLAARLPDAEFVELTGSSANLWDEAPSEAFRLICDFLGLPAHYDSPVGRSGTSTVTLLFTDLESSTAFTARVGDERAQEVLRGHNSTVRTALGHYDGREVKHTGDGIMASFQSAVSAIEAALKIHDDLANAEIRVRIGLNAGEPIAEDDDYFGTAVQLASRITDHAEPGQVLVSDVVRQLCAGKGFTFTSAGSAELKGFDEPIALYGVGRPS